jgi:two-component system repressor protein LuxO
LPQGNAELRNIERTAIERAITSCGGSIPKAAKLLGVSPSTIYRKRESWLANPAN